LRYSHEVYGRGVGPAFTADPANNSAANHGTDNLFRHLGAKKSVRFLVYQELIYQLRPDVILEFGNRCGGTLALAHLCDALGKGKINGLDITHEMVADITRSHPRITLIEGDACTSYGQVKKLINDHEQVLVIEDGICHHGLDIGPQPGPYEAVETFITEDSNFEVERSKESFLITWNPKGFLRRVK
jgi:cephalosporin hydroxylase